MPTALLVVLKLAAAAVAKAVLDHLTTTKSPTDTPGK